MRINIARLGMLFIASTTGGVNVAGHDDLRTVSADHAVGLPISDPGPEDCAVQCFDNEISEQHFAPLAGEESTHKRKDGSHNSNYSGLCTVATQIEEAKHPECPPSFAAAKAVEAALRTRDMQALATLLSGSNVYLATERSAIQVLACTGEVAAHFRLPSSDMERITAIVDE